MPNAYQADADLLTAADSGLRWRTQALVVHTSEGTGTADALARYCQDVGHEASYNLIIDSTGRTARSNDDDYAPWAAGWTGNHIGFHVCLVGFARFTREDWLARPAQMDTLRRVLDTYGAHYGIPLRKITAADLRAGHTGVCGHADISDAWHEVDHTDPGRDFPWDRALAAPPPSTGDTDMTPDQDRMLRELHDAILTPRASLIDGAKRFDLPTLLSLIDAATWRTWQLARKAAGLDYDRAVDAAGE